MIFKSETFKNVKEFKKAYNHMRNDIIDYFNLYQYEGYIFHMPNNLITLHGVNKQGDFRLISGSIANFKEWVEFSNSDFFYLKCNIEINKHAKK